MVCGVDRFGPGSWGFCAGVHVHSTKLDATQYESTSTTTPSPKSATTPLMPPTRTHGHAAHGPTLSYLNPNNLTAMLALSVLPSVEAPPAMKSLSVGSDTA